MKKWLLMVGALLLTACSSGVENKSYYQLPVAPPQAAVQASTVRARATASCGLSRLPCRIIWQETAWSIRPATLNT